MRKKLGRVLLAVFISLSIPVIAPAQDNGFEKAVLKNGMTVLTQEDGGDLGAACLFIKVGAVDENKALSGITNLLNSVILSCHPAGNPNPPALKLEQLGGRVKVETRSDFTCFTLVAPTKNFGAALKVLGDALARLSCSDAALGVEKEALVAREDWLADRLEDKAYRQFQKKTYDGFLYGLAPEGDSAVAMKLGQEDLQRWRLTYYRPEYMLLSIAGKFSAVSAAKMAEAAFQPAPELEAKPGPRPTEVTGPITKNETVVGVSQAGWAAAVIGYTAPAATSPDYPAMKFAEAVLSGGMGSKVFRELRDKRDLAYKFGSYMPPMRDTSRIAFYVVAGEDRVDDAVAGIKRSVEALKAGSVSDEELVRARGLALGDLALEQETAFGRAWYAGFYEMSGLGADYGARLVKQIERLDRKDLIKAARKYLDNYTLVMLKPQK